MEILLQIIEEEINSYSILLEQDDYGGGSGSGRGLGRIIDRSELVGAALSPLTDLANILAYRGTRALVKATRTVAELVASAIVTVLPFNKTTSADINNMFQNWEHEALGSIEQQFAQERKEMMEGWETFKTDFWGIGFVASPMNAITAAVVGGKISNVVFSALNIVTQGRAERVFDTLTGGRSHGGRQRYYEAKTLVTDEETKKEFKDLTDDEKKEILEKLIENPELNKAAKEWSTKNLPNVMGKLFGKLNKSLISGKVAPVSSQEIKAYKAKAPKLTADIFDQLNKSSKKFKIEPSPEALQATSQVVQSEIQKLPDVKTTPIQPQPANQTEQPTVAQPVEQQPKQ